MDRIYTIIYKATNLLNGKCYIGFDSKWPNRKCDHLKPGNYKRNNNFFHNAIHSYGKDKFVWEVLYQSKDKEHTLKDMENYFIVENRSYIGFDDCNGYNMTLGGEATIGLAHSHEWKLNHSSMMKGRKFTDEHKLNLSASLKGKKRSEETCKKLSEINSGENNWQIQRKDIPHPRAQKYIGIDPTGNVHFIHGLSKFCKENNLPLRNASLCANGLQEVTKGWKFYIYEEKLFNMLKEENNENTN